MLLTAHILLFHLAVKQALSIEENKDIQDFVNYAVDLLRRDLDENFNIVSKRSANDPGYFALPLPPLPTDVTDNLSGMQLATDVDTDLVQLANSLFGTEEVKKKIFFK